MVEDTAYEKRKWSYYRGNVEKGYFSEYDENDCENYDDLYTYESAVDYFGLEDAITIIEYNKKSGNRFIMNHLVYVYDYEDWRS